MKNLKNLNKKGITLIALVISIVVLIILAGVAISAVFGQNGLLSLAKRYKAENEGKVSSREQELRDLYSKLKIADNGEATIDYETLEAFIKEVIDDSVEEKGLVSQTDLSSLQTQINQKDRLPVGTIINYSVNNVPTGYLECNGQAVSRTEYSELFGIIGTTYGAGNGSTTFNVPDLRGEFLRGAGTNSTTGHSGASNVGTHQAATIHNVSFGEGGERWNRAAMTDYLANTDTSGKAALRSAATNDSGNKNNVTAYYTSRPTNTSVLYCIKAK